MMAHIFIRLLFLLSILGLCVGRQYVVVGGRQIRPHSDYSVGVSWGGTRSNIFLLELTGHRLPGGPFREAQQLVIEPDTTKVVIFKIGKLEPGNYNLTVRSTSGEEFSNSVQLQYVGKSYCNFLHTDKTVYEPGDIIHFRLLVLNKYLKPSLNIKPQLTLKDGRGNVVRRWLNIGLTKGVFSGEFQLADFPVLGDWIFEIESNNQLYTKKVFVGNFVLPKFIIEINAPKHIYFKDEKFNVSVRAKEHTGQDINGELTVTAYPVFFSGVIQPIFQNPVRKVMNIKGYADIELNIKDDLRLTEVEGNERSIVVEASIEESLTGRRHNVSVLINLHRNHYLLNYHVPSFYKPNLPYMIQMKTTMWQSKMGVSKQAFIKYSFDGRNENTTEVKCEFDVEGNCRHSFNPSPINSQSKLNVEIFYMDIHEKVSGIQPSNSLTDSFIRVQLISTKPSVNGNIKFRIESTEAISFFSYCVLGRGDIVIANTVQVVPAKKVDEFEFYVTSAMAPEATIIVYFAKNNQEIIADSFKFKVDGLMQNNVKLQLKQTELDPSGNLDISIITAPNSYVAVMAGAASPDFSISTNHHYSAGEGSGLTMNEVLREIRDFSGLKELQHSTSEISVSTASEIFQKAGAFLMTDFVTIDSMTGTPNEKMESSTRPPLAGPYAFSHIPVQPAPLLHLGKMPTTTWLFTNITLGADGQGTLGRRVPSETDSDFGLGAWAIHPTLGLGFAPAIKANVRRQMLAVSAPMTSRIGETLAVIATLSSHNGESYTGEVTLHNNQHEFKFYNTNDDANTIPKLELYQTYKISVPKNHSSSAVFFITPTISPDVAGSAIKLEFSSNARGVSETTQHYLTVFPDGEKIIDQYTDMVDFTKGPVNLTIPLRKYSNKKIKYDEIYIGATGSFLSSAMSILPKLLEVPPANGYYNMLPLMASVLLIQQLELNDRLPSVVQSTAVDIIQKTYQQQFAYHQNDGSFSINSQTDSKGSIWVTGFTAMWLGRGIRVSSAGIERNVIMDALQWLATQQLADGSFKEESIQLIDDPLQQSHVTLTALTLQAFLDTKFVVGQKYNNLINKALDWLARNIARAAEEHWDAEILAPLSSVLHIAEHPAAAQATHLLTLVANASDGRRWWDLKNVDGESRNPWNKHGVRNIWVTSWGLQALLAEGYLSEALEAARTLVSLLADWSELPQVLTSLPTMIKIAQKVPQDSQGTVQFNCMNEEKSFTLNNQNKFLLQKSLIQEKECIVKGKGFGTDIVSLQGVRRTNVTGAWPRFILDPRIDMISTPHRLQLSICLGFVPTSEEKISGPVLLKLRLPSGFTPDLDIPALKASGLVRAAQMTKDSEALGEPPLKLILAPLTVNERCFTLRASRLYPVANEKPGVITLVDITDNSRRARAFFSGGLLSACELCRGDANKGCGNSDKGIQGGCLSTARHSSPPVDEKVLSNNANPLTGLASSVIFNLTLFVNYLRYKF